MVNTTPTQITIYTKLNRNQPTTHKLVLVTMNYTYNIPKLTDITF